MDYANHRVNVLEVIEGINFPADKQHVMEYAMDHGASDEVVAMISGLENKDYESCEDVNKELAKIKHPQGEQNLYSSKRDPEKKASRIQDVLNQVERQ